MRTRWVPLLAVAFLVTGLVLVLSSAAPQDRRDDFSPVGEALLAADVGAGSPLGSLMVYPLVVPGALRTTLAIEPIADAMREGTVVVEELRGGMSQNRLFASNSGQGTVFAQGGGFFQGGGQDRGGGGRGGGGGGFMFGANSGGEFEVCCVEEGRSTGPSTRFVATSFTLAHPVLRGLLMAGDQARVWREVRREREAFAVTDTASTSYGLVEESATARSARSRLGLQPPTWPRGTSGIVVTCGDRVVGLELYGDDDLLERHRELLLNSYALANAELAARVPCLLGPDDVRAFLRDAAAASYRERKPCGIEQSLDLRMSWHAGSAILGGGRLVHVGLYDTRPLTAN